ncbi:mitotic interactor and substrate of PLK1 isoform X2 [Rana temporaria]|uniref:mitotic interactor and substrate of PLK1 isoform X2 n=1 Tax=Rana temporaria TaxID=8407 RepID=UPI001AAD86F7|nr:mitotic interactor and substrate of PLK1 isoform X2 [Rana temporaria]
MFKYPSPWQVLCSSLEKREQVSVSGEEGSSNQPESELSEVYRNEYDKTDSTQTIAEISTPYQIIGSLNTDSNTEDLQNNNEDIKNAFKLIELRSETQTERELNVHTTNIHEDEEINNICEVRRQNTTNTEANTAPDVTMDRVTRSPIFSLSSSRSIDGSREDLANATPEESQWGDKRKDVWIPPPDRNSKLKVLREEERFELRSHRSETSPSKLFVDSDDEDGGKSRLGSRQFTPEKTWELEQERKDIIKKQGQRKSLDAEELINIEDGNDSTFPNKEVNGPSGGQATANVDMEQINFEAARQQFVMLEKKRNSLPITPRLQHRPPRFFSQSQYENDSYSDVAKPKESSILEQDMKEYKNKGTVTQETTGRERSTSLLRKQFLMDFTLDSVDNGEQEESTEGEASQLISEEKDNNIPNPSDETPIEREIRLALEREENLRRERGIQHSVESNEIVEIQKNPVLSISPEKPMSKKIKDKARTAFFLQREIQKEEQREADLKNEGKVAGLYDKGNAQELDERRKLFELPDEIPVQPQKTTTKTTSKEILADIQANTNQRDSGEENETTNFTVIDAPLPYSVRTKWKPTPLNSYRTRRLSIDNILDVWTPPETPTAQETSEETFVHKENFQVQPLKFSIHVQEGQAEEEKDVKMEKTPESANGGLKYNMRLRPSRSIVIEEEIRKTLARDQELQDQRRNSELTPVVTSKDDHYGYNQYGRPSLTSDGSKTWSSSSRKSSSRSPLPSYTPNVQMLTPRIYPKIVFAESESGSLKKHEDWYAGIEPSDAVNTEIVKSTRVNRRKNKMALRWEAGLYTNEPSE